jgi:hypothetical protein
MRVENIQFKQAILFFRNGLFYSLKLRKQEYDQ